MNKVTKTGYIWRGILTVTSEPDAPVIGQPAPRPKLPPRRIPDPPKDATR